MIKLEFNQIVKNGPGYVIAEIGHNHQGNLDKALEMIVIAAKYCNVHAVKFQKRHNKDLYTKKFYNKDYNGQNSYGKTYGEHKMVESLDAISQMYGTAQKVVNDFEVDARAKMGKSIYSARPLPDGCVIKMSDICIKSPGGFLPPYELNKIIGKKLVAPLNEEEPVTLDVLEN
jgi:sialic acid synthase SpsE